MKRRGPSSKRPGDNCPFATHIYKVLKQVHPDLGISRRAMAACNAIALDTLHRIAEVTGDIHDATHGEMGGSLHTSDFEAGIHKLLPGQLCVHACEEGKKAISRFSKGQEPGLSARAGLVFPVGAIRRCLWEFGQRPTTHHPVSKFRATSPDVAVYLAAVCEYLIAEILELGGNCAMDYKMRRVTPRHLVVAIREDEELNELYPGTIAYGGVLPRIFPQLMPVRRKRQPPTTIKESSPSTLIHGLSLGGIKKPHRYRPGTVALREIRRFQKSTEMLIQKRPFVRLLKEILYEIDGNKRFGRKGMEALQIASEAYLVQVFENTQIWALGTASRQTIQPEDMKSAVQIMNEHSDEGRSLFTDMAMDLKLREE